MRSFDYARTAPEPPEGALVFSVRLVVVFMGRSYAGASGRRQRFLDGICARGFRLDAFSSREPAPTSGENAANEVEQSAWITP